MKLKPVLAADLGGVLARAIETGMTLPAMGSGDRCDNIRKRRFVPAASADLAQRWRGIA